MYEYKVALFQSFRNVGRIPLIKKTLVREEQLFLMAGFKVCCYSQFYFLCPIFLLEHTINFCSIFIMGNYPTHLILISLTHFTFIFSLLFQKFGSNWADLISRPLMNISTLNCALYWSQGSTSSDVESGHLFHVLAIVASFILNQTVKC